MLLDRAKDVNEIPRCRWITRHLFYLAVRCFSTLTTVEKVDLVRRQERRLGRRFWFELTNRRARNQMLTSCTTSGYALKKGELTCCFQAVSLSPIFLSTSFRYLCSLCGSGCSSRSSATCSDGTCPA